MASPASLADVALVLRARSGTDFLMQSVGSGGIIGGVAVSRASAEASAELARHSSTRGAGGFDG